MRKAQFARALTLWGHDKPADGPHIPMPGKSENDHILARQKEAGPLLAAGYFQSA